LQFVQAKTQKKNCKRACFANARQNRQEMTTKQTKEKEGRRHNITYTQEGVSCFVGKEGGKFKVQFFLGSLDDKAAACA